MAMTGFVDPVMFTRTQSSSLEINSVERLLLLSLKQSPLVPTTKFTLNN